MQGRLMASPYSAALTDIMKLVKLLCSSLTQALPKQHLRTCLFRYPSEVFMEMILALMMAPEA